MTPTPATTPPTAIIERIRKALALAKDRAGEPEGEVAARIALNMMKAHAIEQADLDLAEQARQDPLQKQQVDLHARSMWRRNVFFGVAEHTGCQATFLQGTSCMNVWGYKSNIEITYYLYELICRQIEDAAAEYTVALGAYYSKGEKRSRYNDFAQSAVLAVRHKLIRMREVAQGNADSGTALVLARDRAVEVYFKQTSGKVSEGKTWEGYRHNAAGYEAGNKIQINPGIEAAAGRPVARITEK